MLPKAFDAGAGARRGLIGWMVPWLAGILLLAGCPKGQTGLPEDVQTLLEKAGPGTGVVFLSERDRPAEAMAALIAMVRNRLEAFGLEGLQVDAIGTRAIRVHSPVASEALAERVVQLITRPASLAIAPVEPGQEFFEGLSADRLSEAHARIGVDQVGDVQHGKLGRFWYLASDSPATLRQLVARLSPPAGRRLVLMEGASGAMALLVPDPAPIVNPVLTKVRLVDDDPVGSLAVSAELAQPFRGPFLDLLRDNLHRPLAFLVDGDIVALPVVGGRARSAQIRIEPSPMATEKALRAQGERLAVLLKAWQLVGEFRLAGRRIEPR